MSGRWMVAADIGNPNPLVSVQVNPHHTVRRQLMLV
jgi:hypothetical protein